MSKVRMLILAAATTAGIGLGGTFGASAVPINGKQIGATAPASELHQVDYYTVHARRHYRRAYRIGYYGYPTNRLVGGGYCNSGYCGRPAYPTDRLAGGGYCNQCGIYYSRY
jgi:hypothetical protein